MDSDFIKFSGDACINKPQNPFSREMSVKYQLIFNTHEKFAKTTKIFFSFVVLCLFFVSFAIAYFSLFVLLGALNLVM